MILNIALQELGDEYDKVVIYLRGDGSKGDSAVGLMEAGRFGHDISGTKFIFPITTSPDEEWFQTFSDVEDCDMGQFEECTYDMNDVETSGKEIAAIIQNEIDENDIEANNIFLAGYQDGGRMVWHTAFG